MYCNIVNVYREKNRFKKFKPKFYKNKDTDLLDINLNTIPLLNHNDVVMQIIHLTNKMFNHKRLADFRGYITVEENIFKEMIPDPSSL